MRLFFYLLIFMGTAFSLSAQENDGPVLGIGPKKEANLPEDELSVSAHYKGGMAAIGNFIAEKFEYPLEALENEISGTIVVVFIVDETGKVVNPIIKSGLCTSCNAEALRVVKALKDFEPAIDKNGKPVKSYFTLPIRMMLAE